MIVKSSASSGHCFNGRVERIGWSSVARDLRHSNLHIKPKGAPIFGDIGLATGRDLNSRQAFLRILPTRVEGATCVVRFVVLAIIEFDDIFLDD
jgi:hypothetical protein